MNALRTLIVDDEMPARSRMRAMLEERDDIQVLGECNDGQQALATIGKLKPDLVFLDIQMPEMNGFEVVNKLDPSTAPTVIFVSAYSEHAVRAFEVNALDYLLKPFNTQRLNAAIERVQQRIQSGDASAIRNVSATESEELRTPKTGDRIALKYGGRLHLVEVLKIVWIEAARNYVKVHANGKQYLFRESMKNLETRLAPLGFIRIHRSAIVNVECIESLEPTFHGDYRVFLTDGSTLPLSRNYKHAVQARFGNQI